MLRRAQYKLFKSLFNSVEDWTHEISQTKQAAYPLSNGVWFGRFNFLAKSSLSDSGTKRNNNVSLNISSPSIITYASSKGLFTNKYILWLPFNFCLKKKENEQLVSNWWKNNSHEAQ